MILLDSGTFWAAAGAIAVVVMGLYTVRVTNPKRLLYYEVTATSTTTDLRSTARGHLLVRLRNHGRAEISADLFSNIPFTIDAGVPIDPRSLVISCVPASPKFRGAIVSGSVLSIGPEQIDRRQEITFTADLHAEPQAAPEVAIRARGVKVRPMPVQPSKQRIWQFASAGVTAAAVVVAIVFGFIAFAPRNLSGSGQSGASSTQPIPPSTALPANLISPAAELNSTNTDTQYQGVQALQLIMHQDPSDQSAVLRVLCTFIRADSPIGSNDQNATAVIQAAVKVVAGRNPVNDDGAVIDLHNANLSATDLAHAQFARANLMNADFSSTDLQNATFQGANLYNAYVGGANLTGTNLNDADLQQASFWSTSLCNGSQPVSPQRGYTCTQ